MAQLQGVELRYKGYFNATFHKLAPLGRGSYGKVYKVEKKPIPSGEFYAVKKIEISKDTLDSMRYDLPEGVNPEDVIEREVVAMKALPPHPHIVAYVDSWYENMDDDGDNKKIFILMELCQKETLFHYIQKLPHPPNNQDLKSIMVFFRQIVEGLCHLQAKPTPIIHRDLKPENIMISLKGEIKIGDFGIAAFGGTQTRTHTCGRGTPRYWAPEQASERVTYGRYNNRVDNFSLGLILHHMLYKFLYDPPFSRRQAQENAVKSQFPDHLVEKYPLLFGLLKQMLSDDSSERPSIMDVKERLPSVINELLPTEEEPDHTHQNEESGFKAIRRDMLIRSVSDHIGKDWKRLYEELLSGRDPEDIKSEVIEITHLYPGDVESQAEAALEKWREMNRDRSGGDRLRDLRQALGDIERGDIVSHIRLWCV